MRITSRIWVAIFVIATAIHVAMFVDFCRSNPLAAHVGGDAGFNWETAGQIVQGTVPAGPFRTAPLYLYFLAAVRYIGGGLTSVFILQNLLHLVTAFILGWTVRRRIGDIAAPIAIVLFLSLTEPAILANRLLPNILQLFLVTGVLATAQVFVERPRMTVASSVGLLTGLFALAYPAGMILIPIVVLWLSLKRGKRETSETIAAVQGVRRLRSNRIAVALVGGAAALAPVAWSTLHNWRACGELIPIAAHAGVTMHHGNTEGSTGIYTAVAGVRPFKRTQSQDTGRVFASAFGKRGTHREVDRFFRQKGIDYLCADLGRTARLLARKLYWFTTGRYYADLYHPTLEQDAGLLHLLSLAPLPTAWLMGSTLVGFIFLRRRSGLSALDLAIGLLPLLVVLAFFYTPRYRIPALPIMCLASAATASHAIRLLRRELKAGWQVPFAILIVASPVMMGVVNKATGFDRAENHRPQFECNRGQLLAQQGRFKEAIEHLEESDRLLPNQPVVLSSLTTARIQIGDLPGAATVLARLTEIAPDSLATWLTTGTLELRRNHPTGAAESFAQALRLDANDAEAHLGLWFALAAQNRRLEGLPHLQRCLEIDPTNGPATGEFGLWLASNGKSEEAYEVLARAVELAPNLARPHYNLGVFLLNSGRASDARQYLERVLAIDPGYGKARDAIARVDGARTGSGSNVDAPRRSIRDHPEDESAYSRLAGALFAQGDIAEALDVLRVGTQQATNGGSLAVELSWLLATNKDASLRNGREAIRLMRQVIDASQEPSPEMFDVLAAAYAESGDFEQAIQHAESGQRRALELGRDELARSIGSRLDLYRKNKAFRW